MPLFIPVPSQLPDTDIAQYVPLLLSAVEGFLQLRDVWAEEDYDTGFQYMEALKQWIVRNIPHVSDIPIGMFGAFGQADAALPAKWLWCDGRAISRTTYAALFAVFGTAYGTGNGSTTFNLPDMRSRFLFGAATQSVGIVGATGGEANHALTVAELPAHHHAQNQNTAGTTGVNRTLGGNSSNTAAAGLNTADTGSGTAHNNIPPFIDVQFATYAGV